MSSSKLEVEGSWPLIGYAPGGYTSKCVVCDQEFEGDKRAFNCLPCAALRANTLLAERKALVEALRNARGLLDTPIGRRRHKGDPFCAAVVDSIRAALALTGGQS